MSYTPLTDAEIEALAKDHEAFGFGLVDKKGFTTHGFDPAGMGAFGRAVEAKVLARIAQAKPIAYMWTEYFGIAGSPCVEYSDCPPGWVTNAIPLYASPVSPTAQANREVMQQALKVIGNYADSTAHDGPDDEIGSRVCCGVLSYRNHAIKCPAINAIFALRAALEKSFIIGRPYNWKG
jgi:hypothetical protein